VLLPNLIALAVVVAVGVAVLVLDQWRTPEPSDAARVPKRHAAIAAGAAWACYLGALVVGFYGVVFVNRDLQSLPLGGRTIALVPAAAAVVFLVVHATGDLTWPRPRGSVREARLASRDADDIAPRWLRWMVLSSAGVLVAGMVVLGSIADGPRTFLAPPSEVVGLAAAGDFLDNPGAPVVASSEGLVLPQPVFPGWWYGVPVIIAVLVLVAAMEGVLRLIALRPAVAGVPATWDMALRRRSARRVLRGLQCAVALTGAGVFYQAGLTIARTTEPGTSMDPACLVVVGLFMISAGVVLVVPGLDFRAARHEAAQVAVGA